MGRSRDFGIWTIVIFFVLSLSSTAYSAELENTVVIGRLPRSARTMLELRIKLIHLQGLKMQSAISTIAKSIKVSSGGTLQLSYGLDPSEQYTPKAKRMPQYHVFKMRDPIVAIDARDTTLRSVFDNLCRQTGWSYKIVEKRLIFFTDDRRFFGAGDKPTK